MDLPLDAWFPEADVTVAGLGDGHINRTFLIRAQHAEYVLQGISPSVFAYPETVLTNQQVVLEVASRASWFGYDLPRLLPTLAGRSWEQRGSSYWRLSPRIGQSAGLGRVSSPHQARAAGRAFADYQRLLAAVDRSEMSSRIQPVIPGFHQLASYLEAYAAVRARARSAAEQDLVNELDRRVAVFNNISPAPNSLIHGDCKIDNLLFDAHRSAVIGVVDLDTTMVGQWWWDFGDLVRSVAQSATGEVDLALYDSVASGFFGAQGSLDEQAKRLAQLAPSYMTYMLCVRFLTDHLAGDPYFLVHKRGDNLGRAQAQLRLLLSFEQPTIGAAMAASLERIGAGTEPTGWPQL